MNAIIGIHENVWPLILTPAAIVATTFCLHAALYQSYLVQDKGWGRNELKRQVSDSISGIGMLGGISLKKYLVSQDVGKAINPQAIEGQIEGRVALGYGFAAMEKIKFDKKGNMINADFVDCKLPTTLDLPDVESVTCEIPSHYGPYGAKGLGEATMAPVATAVRNAVFYATGVRLYETPMTPERIFQAVKK